MFLRIRPAHILGLTLVAFCLLIAGCSGGPKLTKETAAKVDKGMTKAEIEGLIGKGKVQAATGAAGGDVETVIYGEGLQMLTVTYEKGKATTVIKIGL